MKLKVGQLVTIQATPENPHRAPLLKEHGYIWRVLEEDTSHPNFKSLATGKVIDFAVNNGVTPIEEGVE